MAWKPRCLLPIQPLKISAEVGNGRNRLNALRLTMLYKGLPPLSSEASLGGYRRRVSHFGLGF
jgi:hypothetical protein